MGESINHICFDYLKDLEINPRQGHFHILIVGTFNPVIEKNKAKWFYGRGESEFWFLLPKMLNKPSLHHADNDDLNEDDLVKNWKKFVSDESILLIDLFKSVEYKLTGFKDSEFDDPVKAKVEPLNFKEAFKFLTFDLVLFTYLRAPSKNGNIDKYMNELKDFVQVHKKAKIIEHLYSPSQLSRGGRKKKLNQWREVYGKLKNATFK